MTEAMKMKAICENLFFDKRSNEENDRKEINSGDRSMSRREAEARFSKQCDRCRALPTRVLIISVKVIPSDVAMVKI